MSSKSDGALNSYLRKAGQVPLLTPDEEIELGRRIQNGDAAARERMIHANLRLVVTIARDYVNLGLPLLDLISEGNIALMEAVGRFDPGKGSKLSTYASWWIKWAIKRALVNQSKTVRLPAQVVDRIASMNLDAIEDTTRNSRMRNYVLSSQGAIILRQPSAPSWRT